MRPINVMIPSSTMIQNTVLQLNAEPMNAPNGTPIMTEMTSPPLTSATALVFLCGSEIAIARLIMTPKKGACIVADNSLERSRTSKFGAVAATVLLMMKIEIIMISSSFGENFNVSRRMTGPNTVTLSAYTLSNRPVVAISTFRSTANCVSSPVTTYSVMPTANVPIIKTAMMTLRDGFLINSNKVIPPICSFMDECIPYQKECS